MLFANGGKRINAVEFFISITGITGFGFASFTGFAGFTAFVPAFVFTVIGMNDKATGHQKCKNRR